MPGEVAPNVICPFELTKIDVYGVPLKENENGSVTLTTLSSHPEAITVVPPETGVYVVDDCTNVYRLACAADLVLQENNVNKQKIAA